MQILKAECGKSEIVMLLAEHSRCMTFCYMDENFFIGNPIGENYICGTEHSLDELKDFIIEEFKKIKHCNQISFLIVYTNLTESEVQPFGKSLENELKDNDLLCRNILLTCRPREIIKRKSWTKEEDKILKKYYCLGTKIVIEQLPYRSKVSITRRAAKLGLRYDKKLGQMYRRNKRGNRKLILYDELCKKFDENGIYQSIIRVDIKSKLEKYIETRTVEDIINDINKGKIPKYIQEVCSLLKCEIDEIIAIK